MKEELLQLFKGLGVAIAATATAFAMMPSASGAAQADTMSAPPGSRSRELQLEPHQEHHRREPHDQKGDQPEVRTGCELLVHRVERHGCVHAVVGGV